MSREIQEPVITTQLGPGRDETVESHPAFGMIGVARTSYGGSSTESGTPLFGSDFRHHNTMRIRVQRAQLRRGLSHDWFYAREQVVEIELSEAQWATFVSSPNVGDGVPCTIRFIGGEGEVPSFPLRTEESVHREEVRQTLRDLTANVDRTIAKVELELAGLSQRKREGALYHLRRLRQDLADNLPWVAKVFGQYMEGVVEKAKIEVNAYVQQSVMRAGFRALGSGPVVEVESPALLPSGDADENP